jgi:hypothetical protein
MGRGMAEKPVSVGLKQAANMAEMFSLDAEQAQTSN